MRKTRIQVECEVEIEYDETKFTEEWMQSFREYMYDFDDVEEHMEHLAQMYVRGVCTDDKYGPPEGYGPLCDMGIKITNGEIETHTWDDEPCA